VEKKGEKVGLYSTGQITPRGIDWVLNLSTLLVTRGGHFHKSHGKKEQKGKEEDGGVTP